MVKMSKRENENSPPRGFCLQNFLVVLFVITYKSFIRSDQLAHMDNKVSLKPRE